MVDESIFYNGVKLINSKDKYGRIPEIFAIDGNRNAGKTTWFSRWLVNRFKKYGEKFMLIYRFQNEMSNIDGKFFGDIRGLFFKNDVMSSKSEEKGLYVSLYLNDELCGWAVPLNAAYKLKKMSHYFTDCKRMFFDEFQVKKDGYVPDEFDKFVTLHNSVARGNGEVTRYVPVYMVSNHISSINPYYKGWGCINEADTIVNGFYKGDGLVVEKCLNEAVAELQRQSAFNRACSGSLAVEHTINNVSLSENHNFIEKVNINGSRYMCNIVIDGKTISLRGVAQDNCRYYFTSKIDPNINTRFVINSSEHTDTTLLVGNNYELIRGIRHAFDIGLVRFSDMATKAAALQFLALTI